MLPQPGEWTDESGAFGGVVQRQDVQPTVSKPARPAGAAAAARAGGVGGNERLSRLAALLETEQRLGRHVGLRELRAAGFSTHDLHALKQWLARQ